MYDDLMKVIDYFKQHPDASQGAAKTAFICYCLAKMVYAIVVGIVVWALGRRIIQATFAALREAKRSS